MARFAGAIQVVGLLRSERIPAPAKMDSVQVFQCYPQEVEMVLAPLPTGIWTPEIPTLRRGESKTI